VSRRTPYLLQWAYGAVSIFFHLFYRKQPGLVVLTAFHGDGYRGNTRVLFESLLEHPTLKAVWLSRSPALVKRLSERFGKAVVCRTHSLAGLKMIARADVILLTHGTSDYPFIFLPRRALIIQTYHGLPTKRGEYLRPASETPPGFLHRAILRYRFKPIDVFLSSSPAVSELFTRRFNLEPTQLAETGFPAYDQLLGSEQQPLPEVLQTNGIAIRKVILYAPTYRRRARTRWFPFPDQDIDAIAAMLEREQALLCLRPHPNDRFSLQRFTRVSNRIMDAGQHAVEEVFQLLPSVDCIITDYSSIYLEGLLRDIPVVFLPYDAATYERGHAFPPVEVRPGPEPSTQADFLQDVKNALHRKDGFDEERKRVRELFFSMQDGRATRNVVALLEAGCGGKPGCTMR